MAVKARSDVITLVRVNDGAKGDSGIDLSNGKMLYTDPTFAQGMNKVQVYNGKYKPTISRVSKSTDNPIVGSSYELKIVDDGTTYSGWAAYGGFGLGNQSRPNAVFIYRIIAKIPTDKKINFVSNNVGISAAPGNGSGWLTSNVGTGNFTEYLYKLVCYSSGTFSSTGFFYLDSGSAPTSSDNLVWHVAYATCFDMTNASDAIDAKNKADNAQNSANEAKKIATNYISTDTMGLMVADMSSGEQTPSNASGANTLISSDGLHVRKGQTVLASFLDSGEQIGRTDESHVNVDFHSFKMIDMDGNTYVHFSDLRDKDGKYDVTDNFIGNGTATDFICSFYVASIESLTIDGTEADSSTYHTENAIHLIFSTAPADGAKIILKYTTTGKYTKAFTIGERNSNAAIGTYSMAFGSNVSAPGYVSYAEGYGTRASKSSTHAEGYKTVASGHYAHSENENTVASGMTSHAGGYYSNASGFDSFVHGEHVNAKENNQVVFGRYNADNSTAAFIIGNGTSDSARSNLFEIGTDSSGNPNISIGLNKAYHLTMGAGDTFTWIDCRDSSETVKNNIVMYPDYTQMGVTKVHKWLTVGRTNAYHFAVGSSDFGVWLDCRKTSDNTVINNALLYSNGNAQIAGFNLWKTTANGTWPKIATVGSDGGMEIGKYIDFHSSSNSTEDHTCRLDTFTSNVLNCNYTINAPNFTGKWNGYSINNIIADCARIQCTTWGKECVSTLYHGIVVASNTGVYLFWYAGNPPSMSVSYKVIWGSDNVTFTTLNGSRVGNLWKVSFPSAHGITIIGRNTY